MVHGDGGSIAVASLRTSPPLRSRPFRLRASALWTFGRRSVQLPCPFCGFWIRHCRPLLTGYEGYQYPHFLDWGYRIPTFQNEKVKNIAVTTVNRDYLRLNYNKTVFGRGSAMDPVGRAHDALSDFRVGWGGIPPHSDPLSSLGPRASHSPSELVTPLLDQSYAPVQAYWYQCWSSMLQAAVIIDLFRFVNLRFYYF